MPATSLIDNLMAMLGLPLAFAVTGFGIGLFIERILRLNVPNALLIPLGACGSIVLSLVVYSTGLGDTPAVALTIALTIAGGVLARRDLRARLNVGWAGAAGLATYLVFLAPELLTGHWTWSGYNFVNDSSVQMVLAEYLKAHGTKAVDIYPPRSTTTEFVRAYLETSYPMGTQGQLATLSGLLNTGPAVLYQGYISALAGMTAMALTTLSDSFLGPRKAALASFLGVSAALTYQYALQGGIKEIGELATCVTAIAVACHVVRRGIDIRGAMLTAVPMAAAIDVYYAAALPFVGAVAVVALAAAFLLRRNWPDVRLVVALALAPITAVVLALPAVISVADSYASLTASFGTSAAATADLGQLARPLPLSQVSGVWLGGDYRFAITAEPAGLLTAAATVLIFALALLGAARALRAREVGPPMLLGTFVLLLAVVLPRVSPYAGGKALAIASPAIVVSACIGALARRPTRRTTSLRLGALRLAGGLAVACVALAVLVSDAVAYNFDYVAPTSRILAVEQVAHRFTGRGLILWNEFEEYAKVFGPPARVNNPGEADTVRQLQLGAYLDLDQEPQSFVESFPVIVMRRSPAASRPPANYRLAYTNSYYEAWVREDTPQVLRHLPAQGVYSASAPVGCPAVRALVAGAPPGSYLVAALPRFVTSFNPPHALHTEAWPIDGVHPDALTIVRGGFVLGNLTVPRAGSYELYVQGNLPGGADVVLDGAVVGKAEGVNTESQWYPVAQVHLTPGPHFILVRHAVDYLQPGNGGSAWLGPVALAASQQERLVSIPTAHWRSLCGRTLDWLELVRH